MTESEWLTSEDPAAMLRHLTQEFVGYPWAPDAGVGEKRWVPRQSPLISERKAKLLWQTITKESNFEDQHPFEPDSYIDALGSWCEDKPHTISQVKKAQFFREIVGNPFAACRLFRKEWLTPAVKQLAQAIYDGKECEYCDGFGYTTHGSNLSRHDIDCRKCKGAGHTDCWDTMPILGDALEEVGCTDEGILRHCREDGCPHVRGCWVIDLILGFEW